MGSLVIRYLDIIKKYLKLVKEKSNYEIQIKRLEISKQNDSLKKKNVFLLKISH